MKTGAGIVALALGLALLSGRSRAEEVEGAGAQGRETEVENPVPPGAKQKTRVQIQLNRLIRERAGLASPVGARTENSPEAPADGTLQLEPMLVEGKRELAWPPPLRENQLQEVLRTGTLWKKAGPRFTKRFWVKGDEGIGFSLSW